MPAECRSVGVSLLPPKTRLSWLLTMSVLQCPLLFLAHFSRAFGKTFVQSGVGRLCKLPHPARLVGKWDSRPRPSNLPRVSDDCGLAPALETSPARFLLGDSRRSMLQRVGRCSRRRKWAREGPLMALRMSTRPDHFSGLGRHLPPADQRPAARCSGRRRQRDPHLICPMFGHRTLSPVAVPNTTGCRVQCTVRRFSVMGSALTLLDSSSPAARKRPAIDLPRPGFACVYHEPMDPRPPVILRPSGAAKRSNCVDPGRYNTEPRHWLIWAPSLPSTCRTGRRNWCE